MPKIGKIQTFMITLLGKFFFIKDEQGRPRGAGIMEFASTDLAKRAIEKMNRFDFKGRLCSIVLY